MLLDRKSRLYLKPRKMGNEQPHRGTHHMQSMITYLVTVVSLHSMGLIGLVVLFHSQFTDEKLRLRVV